MQTVSNANTKQKKKKKKHMTQDKSNKCGLNQTINISHILIMAHWFKVYRTKALCRKNKHIRERAITNFRLWVSELSMKL